jgi:hypothetical protein
LVKKWVCFLESKKLERKNRKMKIDPKTLERINRQRKRRAARAAAELNNLGSLPLRRQPARVPSADLASPGSTATAAARTADDADPGQPSPSSGR